MFVVFEFVQILTRNQMRSLPNPFLRVLESCIYMTVFPRFKLHKAKDATQNKNVCTESRQRRKKDDFEARLSVIDSRQ